jgi:Mg2+/Co2+ transporter CorC
MDVKQNYRKEHAVEKKPARGCVLARLNVQFLPSMIRAFQQRHTQMALVVDEHGTLRGLVTVRE